MPDSGWFMIDKAYGMTSTEVVRRLRRRVGRGLKVGHCGTLDPLATGLLPVAVGSATKAISCLRDLSKTYEFTILWGKTTDTLDQEGKVVSESAHRPSLDSQLSALGGFVGGYQQVPPRFSAVHVKGQRAYTLARSGAVFSLPPKAVDISAFELVDTLGPDRTHFRVVCGAGMYVRSLCRDLCHALGVDGSLSFLRRTSVGSFSVQKAISLEVAVEKGHNHCMWPLEEALEHVRVVHLTEADGESLCHGRCVPWERVLGCSDPRAWLAKAGGHAVALVSVVEGQVKPLRVLRTF